MEQRGRVLVTGASVAGPAAAFWLSRAGYDVTVVERADRLRPGGQNVDVRGTGREVLRRMGVEDAVKARNTTEVGTRFVHEDGSAITEVPVDDGEEADGPTAELEILRGALAEVLVDACPDGVEWRFGDHVTSVEQDDTGVTVGFAQGATEVFDLVVVAEGVDSPTRRIVLGDVAEERPLGMYAVYGTIDRTESDDHWWRIFHAPGSRQAALRPDDEGTTRANLNFLVDEPVLADLDDPARRAAVRERYADVGWEVPRILDGFDTSEDLYVDWLRQVVVPTWHHGRVCLVGDAAWCVTPIGGGGTALALTGAYVLAAELSRDEPGAAPASAFERYEAFMRPVVEDAQDLPPGVPRLAAPRTRLGVAALRLGTKVVTSTPVRAVVSRATSGPQSEQPLPDLREADA